MCAYKKIDTVCPYCGTGCVITCTVDTLMYELCFSQSSVWRCSRWLFMHSEKDEC